MSSAGSLGYLRLTVKSDADHVPLREGSAATWGGSVVEWQNYIKDKRDKRLVFVGDAEENRDQFLSVPYAHRFQQEYTRMQYAKMQSYIRGALAEYDDPHLAILTFTTSTTKPNGELRPPLDHMDEVLMSWRPPTGTGAYYELQKVMAGDRERDPWEPRPEWEYLYILEPTTDAGQTPGGYAHAHVGIVVDGPVEPVRFESVIQKHLEVAPNATGDAHELKDAAVVRRAADLDNPGAYLFKYLGKSWDMDGMSDYEKRFAALLFDQGRQRFRASNGAQRWMAGEEGEEAGRWTFAGVGEADAVGRMMAEYDDAGELAVATERGVRAYLNQHGAGEGSRRPVPDVPRVSSSAAEELLFIRGHTTRQTWMDGFGSPSRGDRPPP